MREEVAMVLAVRFSSLLFSFELCLKPLPPERVYEILKKLAIFFWIMHNVVFLLASQKPPVTSCYFLLNYAVPISSTSLTRSANLQKTCYFLLNYARGHANPKNYVLSFWSCLLFSFELCGEDHYVVVGRTAIACYFLLNYAFLLSLRACTVTWLSNLAIFFWIMLIFDMCVSAAASLLPISTILLFSFELCRCSLDSISCGRRSSCLLFSFELCMQTLELQNVEWRYACYFLLNYASFSQARKNKKCREKLAIFFWIMLTDNLFWENRDRYRDTCYFLLNYAQERRNIQNNMAARVGLAIFFWIMLMEEIDEGYPYRKITTCYFLLNYAYQYQFEAVTAYCSEILLFSFELCLVKTQHCTGIDDVFKLAIFFWIMRVGIQMLRKDHQGRILLFSFELCSYGRTSIRTSWGQKNLLFSFELCWTPEIGYDTIIIVLPLLFSFELCVWPDSDNDNVYEALPCYFLLNYATSYRVYE